MKAEIKRFFGGMVVVVLSASDEDPKLAVSRSHKILLILGDGKTRIPRYIFIKRSLNTIKKYIIHIVSQSVSNGICV